MSKTFAETYTMRSRFFHDLGESAKKLADTYVFDTDLENRAAFKELVWDAVRLSLIEHHGFKPEELGMTQRTDPLDLLAFIESGMSMTSEQIAARWPEWSKMKDGALARFERENSAYQLRWETSAGGSSDPMVSSPSEARYHWVYLPLIREALGKAPKRAKPIKA